MSEETVATEMKPQRREPKVGMLEIVRSARPFTKDGVVTALILKCQGLAAPNGGIPVTNRFVNLDGTTVYADDLTFRAWFFARYGVEDDGTPASALALCQAIRGIDVTIYDSDPYYLKKADGTNDVAKGTFISPDVKDFSLEKTVFASA